MPVISVIPNQEPVALLNPPASVTLLQPPENQPIPELTINSVPEIEIDTAIESIESTFTQEFISYLTQKESSTEASVSQRVSVKSDWHQIGEQSHTIVIASAYADHSRFNQQISTLPNRETLSVQSDWYQIGNQSQASTLTGEDNTAMHSNNSNNEEGAGEPGRNSTSNLPTVLENPKVVLENS